MGAKIIELCGVRGVAGGGEFCQGQVVWLVWMSLGDVCAVMVIVLIFVSIIRSTL